MVNWYWKHKLGEIHYYDNEHKQHWKLELFGGNMTCAFIYRFKDENGKKMYNFFGFFSDLKHAERVLKDDKDFLKNMAFGNHTLRKVKLCVTSKTYKFSNKEMLKLAKMLTEHKYKVELY